MLVPFLLQFQLRPELGMALAPEKGLVQRPWADSKWLDLGRGQDKQELMGRNRLGQEKTLSSPKESRIKLLLPARFQDQQYVAR